MQSLLQHQKENSAEVLQFHKKNQEKLPDYQKEKEYYLLTAMVNDKPIDITMASMRRSRLAVDEDLQSILDNEICRNLHQAGDDEQRAVYLAGKRLKVKEVVKAKNRFDDSHNVYIPIFEEI